MSGPATLDAERLRALVEGSPDGIGLVDAEGRWIYQSPAGRHLLGYGPEERLGRSPLDLVHPDDLAVARAGFARCLEGPDAVATAEFRARHKDGSWVLVEGSLVNRLHDPAVRGLVTTYRDVGPLRRAEAAVAAGEARLRALLEAAPAVTYAARPDGAFPVTFVSENVRRHLGYAPEAFLADPAFRASRVHPDDAAGLEEALRRLLAEGHAEHEYRFRHADGSWRWVRDEARLVHDGAGRPAEVVGHVQDVTERRRSEARFERLVEAGVVGVLCERADGSVSAANDAFLRMTGYTRDDLAAGRLRCEALAPAGRAAARSADGLAAEGGLAPYEKECRRRDGTLVPLLVGSARVDDEETVHLVLDLTERRRLEEQVRHVQRLEAIGRLAGGVAHEFNNRLAVITGFAEMARRHAGADPRLTRYLREVLASGERAAALVRQLLAFGQQQVLAPRLTDLAAVVEETTRMLARVLGEDVLLETDLRPAPAWVDPAQVQHVLVELAARARAAMQGHGALHVATSLAGTEPAGAGPGPPAARGPAVLTVRDTGRALGPDERARLFDPFHGGPQEDIGLAAVYGAVRQSGGHIEVRSEAAGTTFRIELPCTGPPRPRPRGRPGPPARERTVLLVEDEAPLRDLLREALEAEGYRVLACGTGREAEDATRAHAAAIDLLLTDVVLPDLDGVALAERVWAARPGLPVLFTSGYAAAAALCAGRAARRGTAFVAKPCTPEALLDAVRGLLAEAPVPG